MSKKITRSTSNRLKHTVDLERSLDAKFDSFYADKRRNPQDKPSGSSSEDQPIDFKVLFDVHIRPILARISLFKTTSVTPVIRSLAKRIGVIGGVMGVLALLLGLLAVNIFGGADRVATDGSAVQGAITGTPVIIKPDFETLSAPGIEDIRYDPSLKVASYADEINGIQIVVSQQQMSPEQVNDSLFLLQVAQSFGLQTEFEADKGGVFIGVNNEQQIQTVAFSHNGLLLFIQIQGILDPVDVISYVNTL